MEERLSTQGWCARRWDGVVAAAVLVVAVSAGPGTAMAASFEFGDLEGDFRTRLTTGVVFRAQDRNPALISKLANNPQLCAEDDCMSFDGSQAPNQRLVDAPGLFSGVNLDDGNINYDKGDVTAATTYFTPELTMFYKGFKFVASGLAYYDPENVSFDEFHLDTRYQPAEQPRPDYVTEEFAANLELRDLYVQKFFNAFDREVSLQVGRQTVPWGEATLVLFNSLNELNPLDATIAGFPGFELGQVNRPSGMAVMQTSITDLLAAEFVYQYEWEPVRVPPPGSFLSTNDLIGGTPYAMITLGQFNDDPESLYEGPATGAGLISNATRRGGVRDESNGHPDDTGQYGLRLSYFAPEINFGTEFGVYYLRYHSRLPLVSAFATDESCTRDGMAGNFASALIACQGFNGSINPLPPSPEREPLPINTLALQVEYPEGIDMFGASFNTNIGNWALSGEVAHRRNLPVQVLLSDVIFAALQPGFPEEDIVIPGAGITVPGARSAVPDYVETLFRGNTVQPNQYVQGFERIDATQLSLAGLRIFSQNPFAADQILFLLEGGFWFHHDMPGPQELPFQSNGDFTHTSAGADGTGDGPDVSDEEASRRLNPTQQRTGIPTDFAWGYRALARFTYNEVLPGVTWEPQLLWFHDVNGNTPVPILNFTEGRKSLSFNNLFKVSQSLSLGATYQWYTGGGRHNLERDRDFYNVYAVLNF